VLAPIIWYNHFQEMLEAWSKGKQLVEGAKKIGTNGADAEPGWLEGLVDVGDASIWFAGQADSRLGLDGILTAPPGVKEYLAYLFEGMRAAAAAMRKWKNDTLLRNIDELMSLNDLTKYTGAHPGYNFPLSPEWFRSLRDSNPPLITKEELEELPYLLPEISWGFGVHNPKGP
jgi:hypothetical protein